MQEKAYELLTWKWDSFEEFNEKYMRNPKSWSQWVSFMIYMNGLGILLEEGYIPPELIYKMDQSGSIPIRYWNKFKPIVLTQRERRNEPDHFRYIEYYADEMIKLRARDGKPIVWSEEKATFIE
jgi:hypothetical protein